MVTLDKSTSPFFPDVQNQIQKLTFTELETASILATVVIFSHRMGVWQFLADMPYDSVSLGTIWKIFWNIYCKQSSDTASRRGEAVRTGSGSRGNSLPRAAELEPVSLSPDHSPAGVGEIQDAMKGT